MLSELKFATGLHLFGNTLDRYVGGGYKTNKTLDKMFSDAASVKEIKGVELIANWNINDSNINEVKSLCETHHLDVASIIVDIFTQAKWANGSFAAKNSAVRGEAIEEVKKYMDIAAELGCELLNLWFAHDGYDYCFQSNYFDAWNYLISGIEECANYRDDIKLSIEYKIKEPRTHIHVGTVGKVLLMLTEINKQNVGVTFDGGHALNAYENMAESVALCKRFGDKLFHVHVNDNYRSWDDDMLVGSVHTQEYLELFYWLHKVDYKGWCSLDMFPYREDGVKSAYESIEWLKVLMGAVKNVPEKEIEEVIAGGDAVNAVALMRKMIFNK